MPLDKTIDFLELSKKIISRGSCVRIPVVGVSMFPLIRSRDIIHFQPVKDSGVSIGDVIVYERGERMVAHRLLRKELYNGTMMLTTKGDAFIHQDRPIHQEKVLLIGGVK